MAGGCGGENMLGRSPRARKRHTHAVATAAVLDRAPTQQRLFFYGVGVVHPVTLSCCRLSSHRARVCVQTAPDATVRDVERLSR